ncbi:MAG TPA: hypothetical protein EYG16_11275 [Deltaproteobacteria bacterium]|nr:hypothetical protein [Candidatus Binatota bacterium]HIL14240.1 hypothetical protein [Deltaproteobacteria bacterium]
MESYSRNLPIYHRTTTATAAFIVAALLLLPLSASHAATKSRVGLLGSVSTLNLVTHAQSGDNHAGAVGSSTGKIPRVGKAKVSTSASWDWSAYSTSHPCALFNTDSHVFSTGLTGPFTTDATVTIERLRKGLADPGNKIDAVIKGGSVCEVEVNVAQSCTTNEGVLNFEITGGTGKFATASGTGMLHTLINTCGSAPVLTLSEIVLQLNR